MIGFVLFISNFIYAQSCPGVSDEKLNTSVSKIVSKLCADPEFKDCQSMSTTRGCSYREEMEKELKSLVFPEIECTSLNSFGNVCGNGGGVVFACRCMPSIEGASPFYRFKCNYNSKLGPHCEREIPDSLKDLTQATGELASEVKSQCNNQSASDPKQEFLLDSLSYKPNPYIACVEEVLEKNPLAESCVFLSKFTGPKSKMVDRCWFLVAQNKNDKKICDSIADNIFAKNCKKLIENQEFLRCNNATTDDEIVKCKTLKSTIMEKDYCFEIEKMAVADKCYNGLAINLKDPYYCLRIRKSNSNLPLEPTMYNCSERLAKILASPRICSQIKNPEMVRQCLSQFGRAQSASPIKINPKIKK